MSLCDNGAAITEPSARVRDALKRTQLSNFVKTLNLSHKITNVYSNRSVIFGNRPSFQLRFTLFSNPLTLRVN